MTYKHGIYFSENETSITVPKNSGTIQVVIGTAPVNQLADPSAAVNTPILVTSIEDAYAKIGFNQDFEKFTICEALDYSLNIAKVAPIIVINVMDPATHFEAVVDSALMMVGKTLLVEETGIMIDASLVVKNQAGDTTYEKDTDYTAVLDSNGYLKITSLTIAEDTNLKVSYNQLDITAVTNENVIGSYDALTGKYTGLQLIKAIFQKLNLVPSIIIAPGFSHITEIGAAMTLLTTKISGLFSAITVKDIDTDSVKEYSKALEWKNTNLYTSSMDLVVWPKTVRLGKQYFGSTILAATMAAVDFETDDIPAHSPSNKPIAISGTVLADGTEVNLDIEMANVLNSQGILTFINFQGFRTWGNKTAAYPNTTDPKDSQIVVRRMFNWQANTFIQTYFDEVDDPSDIRQIENLIANENIRGNAVKAKGYAAEMKMEYRASDNSTENLIEGMINFYQTLTPYPATRVISVALSFDPTALGGDQ